MERSTIDCEVTGLEVGKRKGLPNSGTMYNVTSVSSSVCWGGGEANKREHIRKKEPEPRNELCIFTESVINN